MGKQKKRICSFIMAVIMILGVIPMDVFAATKEKRTVETYNGTPVTPTQITSQNYEQFGLTSSNWSTYNGYYGIRNASELYGFAALVNGGKTKSNAVLLQDIVINETVSESGAKYSWTPIGTSDLSFMGTFDGNGCRISGLYMDSESNCVGIFARVKGVENSESVIKNLTLANSYIHGKQYTSGIVGVADGNYVTVSKCRVEDDVTIISEQEDLGGIVGGFISIDLLRATRIKVEKCVFYGKIIQKGRYNVNVEGKLSVLGTGAIVGGYQALNNAGVCIDVQECYFKEKCIHLTNYKYGTSETVSIGKGGATSNRNSNEGCTILSTKTEAHTCVGMEHKEVKSTCLYAGYSAHTFCVICDKMIQGTKIETPACGHDWSEATCIAPKKCKRCELIIPGTLDHQYSYTAEGATITEKCINGCGHEGTAVLKLEEKSPIQYTGAQITPLYVHYKDWIGNQLSIVYSNNVKIGTGKGQITMDKATAEATFEIICNHDYGDKEYCKICGEGLASGMYDVASGEITIEGDDKSFTVTQRKYDEVLKEDTYASTEKIAIMGTSNENSVVVKSGTANVTLIDCKITANGAEKAPFEVCDGAEVNLSLQGDNVLENLYPFEDSYAALHISKEAKVTISGTGKLTASSKKGAAGIGIGNSKKEAGTIIINGGTIVATGGTDAAGIGGGMASSGGTVVINGGNIKAQAGQGGDEAIGKGRGGEHSGTLKNKKGETLYLHKITLNRLTESKGVASSEGADDYGQEGVSSLDHNILYYYLPADRNVTTVTLENGQKFAGKMSGDKEKNGIFYCTHIQSEQNICSDCGNYSGMKVPEKNEKGVYLIRTLDELLWFADYVNKGNATENAQMMNDINADKAKFIGIGTEAKPYAGTFDGNGYKLIISLNDKENVAPFDYVHGAVIKNLTISGKIVASKKYAGSIVSNVSGGNTILEKCISDVEIISNVNGAGEHGGFIGVVKAGNLTIDKCGFYGAITGSATTHCGGFVGWSETEVTITNSYMTAELSLRNNSGSDIFARYSDSKKITIKNYYYKQKIGSIVTAETKKTEEEFASGEVAWLLNGKDSSGDWKQTIGTDKYPNFSGKRVYALRLSCSMTKIDTYSNTPDTGQMPFSHQYENGICKAVEGEEHYQPAVWNGTSYEITNAGQLLWFKNMVNGTAQDGTLQNYEASAILKSDIDLTGYETIDIGTQKKPYEGTFDGNGHSITVTLKGEKYVALFSYVGDAVIEKLTVNGTVQASNSYAAGLVYCVKGSATIRQCISNVALTYGGSKKDIRYGGLVSYVLSAGKLTVNDCAFLGSITAKRVNNCAGMVGYAIGKTEIKNSYVFAEFNFSEGYDPEIFVCASEKAEIELSNLYYAKTNPSLVNFSDGVEEKSAEQFSRGEVAWLLNGKSSEGIWKQTIGEALYPVFQGKKVYQCAPCPIYKNVKENVAHVYGKEGICQNCNDYQKVEKDAQGRYQIQNAGQLFAYAEIVNGGEKDADAILLADIDLKNREWVCICRTTSYERAYESDDGYAGVFDGNGYVIKNINITKDIVGMDRPSNGLFGTVSGTVKNLGIDGFRFTAAGYCSIVGAVAGQLIKSGKIENCYVVDAVTGSRAFVAGGIVGCVYDGTIENCHVYNSYFDTVNGTDHGGIAGKSCGDNNSRPGNLVNCYTNDDYLCGENQGNIINCSIVSTEQFSSGEVTWLLNGKSSKGSWKQTLHGTKKQGYPQFHGETIYCKNNRYSNVDAYVVDITDVIALDSVYDGKGQKGYSGTPSNKDGYQGNYEVTYVGRNKTTYDSEKPPVNVGDYTVMIRTDSENKEYFGVLSLDFSISKKELEITIPDQEIEGGESLRKDGIIVKKLADGDSVEVTVEKGPNCTYTVSLVVKNSLEQVVTDNYKFKNTGNYHEYRWDSTTQEHKCINCNRVNGRDKNAPTATYSIGTMESKVFENNDGFGLFSKKDQTIEILYQDDNSGVTKKQYYLSNKVLSQEEIQKVQWNDYEDAIVLNEKGTYFVYVQAMDQAGNKAVYHSEGIVIYEDSTKTTSVEYTRTSKQDVKAGISFNGNIVRTVKQGETILEKDKDYTVEKDGIVLKSSILEKLPASAVAYEFYVSYDAQGVEWKKDTSYGESPADTVISVTVMLTKNSISNIQDISKTYDGKAVGKATFDSLSTGKVTYEYKKKDANDSNYTVTAPKAAGSYLVRITVAADSNYEEETATAGFEIYKKQIEIQWGNNVFLYDGEKKIPVATAKNVEKEDEINLILSGEQSEINKEGESYVAAVTAIEGKGAENYVLPSDVTTTFTIGKGVQKAPENLQWISEDIEGSANGEITGLDETMEYRKKGQAMYTPVTGEKLTNLSSGTYYVRYKETEEYQPSEDKVIVLEPGRKVPVTQPVKLDIKKQTTNSMIAKQKVTLSGKKLTVTWGKATKADGYDVFLRKCDGKSFSKKPTKTIKKNSVISYTFTKISGKKINAAKNYKVKVKAYQYKNGKKVYIGATNTLHVVGKGNKKYTNAKKVMLNKTKITLKAGKMVKISAKTVKENSKKKLLCHSALIRYYSTNTKIATVDKKGRIKAVAKGKAKIYAVAENGVKAFVTVTVK